MANFVKIQFAFFALAVVGQQVVARRYGSPVDPSPSTSSDSGVSCLRYIAEQTKRPDYTYTPGIGAHKVHTQAAEWNVARKTCESEGGYLAIIDSPAESEVLVKLITAAGPVNGTEESLLLHMGFHDLYQEGEFVTILGQPLETTGFNQWADGEPNNAGNNENCGCMYTWGKLNDLNCKQVVGFVCELPYDEIDSNIIE